MTTHRRTILALASTALVCASALAARRGDDMDYVDPELRELKQSLSQMKQEISCLNLINGLNLTPGQVDRILALADEQQAARRRGVERAAAKAREMLEVFSELKSVLEGGQAIPRDLARRVSALDQQQLRRRSSLGEEVGGIAKKLDAILTGPQLKIVEGFKPCLLPPRDLRDPVRAGQADDSGRAEEFLRRTREIPADGYRRVRERIVDRRIAFVEERHGKYTKSERAKEKKRLLALLDKARRLSDVDFEMQKADLSAKARPRNKIGDLVKQIEKAKPGGSRSKAARFLLSPAAISVLRKKAAKAAND